MSNVIFHHPKDFGKRIEGREDLYKINKDLSQLIREKKNKQMAKRSIKPLLHVVLVVFVSLTISYQCQ